MHNMEMKKKNIYPVLAGVPDRHRSNADLINHLLSRNLSAVVSGSSTCPTSDKERLF